MDLDALVDPLVEVVRRERRFSRGGRAGLRGAQQNATLGAMARLSAPEELS